MTLSLSALRRFWLNVHLWIGVGLTILIVPISVSGGLLVFESEIEEILHPSRYAAQSGVLLQPSAYLAAARTALPAGAPVNVVRFPDGKGPVIVNARVRGTQPLNLNVYLDPSTARVIEVTDVRGSFFGFLKVFHENLTIPEYSGRAIVGWVGVAMLISSLSGIYLWWPRVGGWAHALRWRRSSSLNFNLHHTLGFWISIPLAVVSLTGVYLGFPQQGRDLLASITPLSPRVNYGAPVRNPAMTPDDALAKAVASEPGARVTALFMASGSQGSAPVWRAQLRMPDTGATQLVIVRDTTGATERVTALTGDRIARWIRWIHEGSNSGIVWKVLVFLCGVFPPIFAVTGIVMWLRRRKTKTMRGRAIAATAQPAE